MSFGFSAIGTAAECAAQLSVVQTDNVLGQRLADTLVELLGDEEQLYTPGLGSDGEYRYVVEASGHSGRSSTTYLSVESVWVPTVAVELGEAFKEIDERAEAALAAADGQDF